MGGFRSASRTRVLAAFALLASGLAGCTSGPALKDYPERLIDRPYTLPKGVTTWHTLAGVSSTQYDEPDRKGSTIPILFPFEWESSISDDTTLTWILLPLFIRHQTGYSETHATGFALGVESFGYSSIKKFFFNPTVQAFHRQNLNEDFALQGTLSGGMTYYANSDSRAPFNFGIKLAPLWQAKSWFALQPGIEINLIRTLTTASFYDQNFNYVSTEFSDLQVDLPLSLAALFHLGRQWDLTSTYQWGRIGFQDRSPSSGVLAPYTQHQFILDFTHFW